MAYEKRKKMDFKLNKIKNVLIVYKILIILKNKMKFNVQIYDFI